MMQELELRPLVLDLLTMGYSKHWHDSVYVPAHEVCNHSGKGGERAELPRFSLALPHAQSSGNYLSMPGERFPFCGGDETTRELLLTSPIYSFNSIQRYSPCRRS